MFTKKPEKEMRPPDLARSSPRVAPSAPTMQRPVGVTRPGYKSSSSIIGADLTIIGNLVSKGEVQHVAPDVVFRSDPLACRLMKTSALLLLASAVRSSTGTL